MMKIGLPFVAHFNQNPRRLYLEKPSRINIDFILIKWKAGKVAFVQEHIHELT